jgi:hypothetical protein
MPAALSLALKMRESPKPVLHIIAEFERRRWREYERARPGEPRRSHDKVRAPRGVRRARCRGALAAGRPRPRPSQGLLPAPPPRPSGAPRLGPRPPPLRHATPPPQAYLDSLKEPFCLAERAILFVVGFEFGLGDPYPHVAKQLRALGLTDEADRSAKIAIQQNAWNILRDRFGVAAAVARAACALRMPWGRRLTAHLRQARARASPHLLPPPAPRRPARAAWARRCACGTRLRSSRRRRCTWRSSSSGAPSWSPRRRQRRARPSPRRARSARSATSCPRSCKVDIVGGAPRPLPKGPPPLQGPPPRLAGLCPYRSAPRGCAPARHPQHAPARCPLTFTIPPGPVPAAIVTELTYLYLPKTQHAWGPGVAAPPPGSGRRPVTMPAARHVVQEGESWTVVIDGEAAAGGGGGGGGSHPGGEDAGAALARSCDTAAGAAEALPRGPAAARQQAAEGEQGLQWRGLGGGSGGGDDAGGWPSAVATPEGRDSNRAPKRPWDAAGGGAGGGGSPKGPCGDVW